LLVPGAGMYPQQIADRQAVVLFLMMNMNVSDQRTRGNRRLVLVEVPGWMRVALGDRQSGLVGLAGSSRCPRPSLPFFAGAGCSG